MLQIPLSPETEAPLRERATVHGEDVAVYVARLLQDALTAPSVEQLLRPFRQQVDSSGATDQELDSLCEELRQEVWEERNVQKAERA
jgi:hypothetical protein